MKQSSIMALPFILATPQKAFAEENLIAQIAKLPRDAPLIDLLDQYIKIFTNTGSDVFQQIINFNKFIIELIDFFLDHSLNLT